MNSLPNTDQQYLPDRNLCFIFLSATVPWNDSLRARIYAQYAYLANTQRDPSRHAAMQRKADALYNGDLPGQ